ncbi:MAG TPA: DUF86 domain-containing protein [Persephonella sp.]|nr:DUF86 domain-containing protein [Persephonella sp.]
MSKRDYRLFLEDILEEIERIREFTKDVKTSEDLEQNIMLFYAVLKAFENIGEATKNIPPEIREKYSYQWKKVAGLRDIITHEYWGIDAEIIYDVINSKLLELEEVVKNILKQENKQ